MEDLEDFNSLKCSTCKKYLSVPPIYISQDNKLYKCGRCEKFSEQTNFLRCTLYEKLAKMVTFPCSISEDCPEKLKWNEALKHEKKCHYRKVFCAFPACTSNFELFKIENHFREQHADAYIEGDRTKFDVLLDNSAYSTTNVFLFRWTGALFLVYFKSFGADSKNSQKIIFNVFQFMLTEEKYSFIAKISSPLDANRHVQYGAPISILPEGHTSLKINIMDYSAFNSLDKSDIGPLFPGIENDIEIIICNTNISSDITHALSVQKNEYINVVRSHLECPVCFKPMNDVISFCQLGHSLCQKCKLQLQVCPICRLRFSSARNYTLEYLFREIVKLDTKNRDSSQNNTYWGTTEQEDNTNLHRSCMDSMYRVY